MEHIKKFKLCKIFINHELHIKQIREIEKELCCWKIPKKKKKKPLVSIVKLPLNWFHFGLILKIFNFQYWFNLISQFLVPYNQWSNKVGSFLTNSSTIFSFLFGTHHKRFWKKLAYSLVLPWNETMQIFSSRELMIFHTGRVKI